MATLSAHSPGKRVGVGNATLQAAKHVDTKLIRAKLARFAAAHRKYVAANNAVIAAESKLRSHQEKVGEDDVLQDAAVE